METANKNIIEQEFADIQNINTQTSNPLLRTSVAKIIKLLETGKIRIIEYKNNTLIINEWIKKAILIYFKLNKNNVIQGNITNFFDKIPLQFNNYTQDDFIKKQTRIVPSAIVRAGAYIGNNCVLMPSYVNIGAYIGDNSMIDTWATIGSCAQIGKNVHISGGAGIGGVLEPLQANPTIIQDNCFIGARSEIVEGVIVEKNSVISMGVFIGQSTKIYDRENDTILYGTVPEGSVVIPGSLPSKNGKYNLNCAVIIKKIDEKTRKKVMINDLLRDHIISDIKR